jgi:hypothetical protein
LSEAIVFVNCATHTHTHFKRKGNKINVHKLNSASQKANMYAKRFNFDVEGLASLYKRMNESPPKEFKDSVPKQETIPSVLQSVVVVWDTSDTQKHIIREGIYDISDPVVVLEKKSEQDV